MTGKTGENEGIICNGPETVACVVCSQIFTKSRSRQTVCSPECRRERGRRYSKNYYRDAMDIRDRMVAAFGGRKPSGSEIVEMLQAKRKDRNS